VEADNLTAENRGRQLAAEFGGLSYSQKLDIIV